MPTRPSHDRIFNLLIASSYNDETTMRLRRSHAKYYTTSNRSENHMQDPRGDNEDPCSSRQAKQMREYDGNNLLIKSIESAERGEYSGHHDTVNTNTGSHECFTRLIRSNRWSGYIDESSLSIFLSI